MRLLLRSVVLVLVSAGWSLAQKYSGPVPEKADVPYLLHADNLVETEVSQAREEKRRDETLYRVPGVSSPSRTPLAEPVFLLRSEKIGPESLELYRLEVKGGNREVVFQDKRRRGGPRPFRLVVTRLAERLYRIEVSENLGLENGQYLLTPSGSNEVFCFEVY
jgi:hypothetical protein